MTGVIPKFTGGPVTYPVSAKVRAGRLVAPTSGSVGTVAEAAAGSTTVLGVAMTDAIVTATAVTDDFGQTITPMEQYPNHTTVAGPGDIIPVTYAANASFGALLKAAANGTVTPAVLSGESADDFSVIVGRCVEPGGVTVATNPTGLMRIQ